MRGPLTKLAAALGVLAMTLWSFPATAMAGEPGDWLQFAGNPNATGFSSLKRIDTGNVQDLRVAWVADLGFTGRFQGSPAAWDGRLFVSTESGVVALDGATGEVVWRFIEGDGDRTDAGLPIQAPRGSPVILPGEDGATVFASLPSAPTVVALDALDGKVK